MMDDTGLVWIHLPDHDARRRLRTQVRFGALGVSVLLVLLGWSLLGVSGGLAALAVMLLITLTVEAWARGGPDDTVHRIWLDGDTLCADGPEVFERDGDGFELVAEPGLGVIDLVDVASASVYPSVTDDEGQRGFHLVVDLVERSGRRRCLVLDRRIPFRLGGELGLASSVQALVGSRWRDPETLHDTFGELDRRRLSDWASVGRS